MYSKHSKRYPNLSSTLAPMPEDRIGCQACVLGNIVSVVGGCSNAGGTLSSVCHLFARVRARRNEDRHGGEVRPGHGQLVGRESHAGQRAALDVRAVDDDEGGGRGGKSVAKAEAGRRG